MYPSNVICMPHIQISSCVDMRQYISMYGLYELTGIYIVTRYTGMHPRHIIGKGPSPNMDMYIAHTLPTAMLL